MNIQYKIYEEICEFEKKTDVEKKNSRLRLRKLLQEFADVKIDKTLTLPQTIIHIAKDASKDKARNIAMIVIYALTVNDLFPENTIDGKFVKLFDKGISDFYKYFEIKVNDQTYKKIELLSNIHKKLCQKLCNITNIDNSIISIIGRRQDIEKTLKDKTLNSYLSYLDFPHIAKCIKNFFSQLNYFSENEETFYKNIPEIQKTIEQELQYCSKNPSFLTKEYYEKYLNMLLSAITSEREKSKDKFKCSINKTHCDKLSLDKKYPLNLVGNEIYVTAPFNVEGNGTARNVNGEISSDTNEVEIINPTFSLGSVKPGQFIVPIKIRVKAPVKSVLIDVLIQWNLTAESNKNDELFQFKLSSQNPNVDWEKLKEMDPYSLEIVYGDAFIGRKDAIRRICNKLLSPTVTSSYITGFKRVGKSSLAHAVMEYGKNNNYSFIYKEYGEYGNVAPQKTLNELGLQLVDDIIAELPNTELKSSDYSEFDGSLAPLIKLVTKLSKVSPENKFVIILDEFDEINHELYRIGPLAEVFFSNLRALSGRKNIGFILVGSEGMPYVMGAQGDKLNKFTEESLESFDKKSEWEDYENLIKQPVKNCIEWHDDAIYAIYEETSGHPFFTKTICSQMVDKSIKLKDSEITGDEVKSSLSGIVSLLDVNTFSHFWKDGIDGNHEEKEIKALKRCKVLVGYGRSKRKGVKTDLKAISEQISTNQLFEDEANRILHDFCLRKVMYEINGEYFIKIKLFERWLVDKGINLIITDQLGDELSDIKRKQDDDAYVKPEEITKITKQWPLYRGEQITSDSIRSWMQQDDSQVNQRLLFTLLKNLRFPKEIETNEMLRGAHNSLKRYFKIVVQRSKKDRRSDILVTYIDGAGKSGAFYASKYTQENKLSTTCNIDPNIVNKRLKKFVSRDVNSSGLSGIVIIDDLIGTGNTLSKNITLFISENLDEIKLLAIPIKIIALFSTKKGEEKVREELKLIDYEDIDLHVCEILDNKCFAFSDETTIWKNEDDKNQAKRICQNLGVKLSKSAPLGYQSQGLLFVLPRNCPNNSLPIFHSSKSAKDFKWNPLFERITAV